MQWVLKSLAGFSIKHYCGACQQAKYKVLILFFGLCAAPAFGDSEKIISGFSEFLIERANANLVAVYGYRLKSNKDFQCYFPDTYEKIKAAGLNDLFVSKSYWEKSLRADLEALIYRSILLEVQQGLQLVEWDKLIEAMQYLVYEYEGQRYPLDQVGLNWSQPLKDQINGFSFGLAKSLNVLTNKQWLSEDVCHVKSSDNARLKELTRPYWGAGESLNEWYEHVEKYGENLRLSEAGKKALYCRQKKIPDADCATAEYDESELLKSLLSTNDFGKLKKVSDLAKRIERAYKKLESLDARRLDEKQLVIIDQICLLLPLLEGPTFGRTEIEAMRQQLQAVKKLAGDKWKEAIVDTIARFKQKVPADDEDAVRIKGMLSDLLENRQSQSYTSRTLVALELLEASDLFTPASFQRLNKSVMFFVSIADAEDEDAVKSILEAHTLASVSFTQKREYGTGYFISSYLGLAASDSDIHDSQEEPSGGGLFVPVGLEINHGFSGGGSFSMMLSPIDLGYPVNLKLNGLEEEVDFDEIIAPSITFAYGFKNYPLNIGLGYQRGRTLEGIDETEERILLFISFDMPLFRLY